jgi:Protein of unknown function (DUF2510)
MTTPVGWYPDPSDPGRQIYWNGTAWSGPAQPVGVTIPAAANSTKPAVAVGVCVLVAIGLVMSMQSVSLLSGSSTVWIGVGFVAAGTAVAFFLGAASWVRVIAALCLAFALFSAVYMEKQLSDKRNEISQIFND